MKKIFVSPLFRAVLRDIVMSILTNSAIDPQERARVQSLLGDLDTHAELVDENHNGIPDVLETPPPGNVRAAGEPSYEELLAAWRAEHAARAGA